jgi:hypothetical protein
MHINKHNKKEFWKLLLIKNKINKQLKSDIKYLDVL